MRTRPALWVLALVALLVVALPAAAGSAAARAQVTTPPGIVHVDDADLQLPVVPQLPDATGATPDAEDAEPAAKVPAWAGSERTLRFQSHGEAVVGEQRLWLALDTVQGIYYLKFFTLRGIGDNIEVWVANNTNFQAGDCRNGVRTTITDAQVQYLVGEFDGNIYPIESEAFSVPPDRDGADEHITGLVPPELVGPGLVHPEGDGDNIVVLVDNVRDENYYDLNNTNGFSYIAGFFSSTLNFYFDRNIMTIDAFDWLHRTGANPPHEPVPGDNCASAPARPYLYEGVFAHEYQHLLMYYEDPDEVNWVNEGLSDWAQTITGYVDPARPITDVGFDSHVQCFLGWLGTQTDANPNPRGGGPENSLTLWGDQGDGEILCDYGAAYTAMEYLAGRFGEAFMTALHRHDDNGLAGLQAVLSEFRARESAQDVLHRWSLSVAVDALLDSGAVVTGHYNARELQTPTLNAAINWATPDAYSTPGAPPNGADYVALRDASGAWLSGGQIRSLSFQGAATLPPKPILWTVDPNPPFQPGDPALYSGAGNNRDAAIVREVTVPTGAGATLTFDALWNEETGWDFGFVQVSTDGGATYTSLACTDTTTTTDPDALPTAKENVPGFTGYSGGWRPQTCSLAAYAGRTVLLSFRTFNDPAVLGESSAIAPGFWVDDVRVGTTLVSDGSTLAGWLSPTEVRPATVSGFTVHLLSVRTLPNGRQTITLRQLPLSSGFSLEGQANVQRYVDRQAQFVGAIVFFDDPGESVDQYAPYRLTVNGVVQPGGGM